MNTPFRHGDIVCVTGTVRHNQNFDDNFIFVTIDGHHSPLMIGANYVTLIAPRMDAGERVRWTNNAEGVVLATHSDQVWVKLDDGSYVVWPALEVKVVAEKASDEPLSPPPPPLDGRIGSEEDPL